MDVFVNDEALWATDRAGDLQLVARTGDMFDVDNNPLVEDLRTIADIGVIANSGGTGGEDTSFNDLGELAFVLRFTDATSGVFVASFAAPTLSGDFDSDGDVDGRDFLIWQRGGSPNPLSAADLADWQASYGAGSLPANIAVPEPGSIVFTMIFAAIGWQFRRISF